MSKDIKNQLKEQEKHLKWLQRNQQNARDNNNKDGERALTDSIIRTMAKIRNLQDQLKK